MSLKNIITSSKNKNNTYFIISGFAIVVIAAIVGALIGKSTLNNTTSGETPVATQAPVPSDVVVPDQNTDTSYISKDVAIPTASIFAAPGVSAHLRTFDIKAEGGKFIPSTVAAYTGDTIHINFTAVDKAYDITFPDYNMKQVVEKGQTKILEFQAQATGKFTYYCDACGGLQSNTLGYVIVAPLKTQ